MRATCCISEPPATIRPALNGPSHYSARKGPAVNASLTVRVDAKYHTLVDAAEQAAAVSQHAKPSKPR